MGTNNLTQIGTVTPTTATGDLVDQYLSAISVDFVPRSSSGVVTASAGDIGTGTYPWKNAQISATCTTSVLAAHNGTVTTTVTVGALKVNSLATFANTVIISGNLYSNGNVIVGSGKKISTGGEVSPDCIPGGITLSGSQAATTPIITIKNPAADHLIGDAGITEADTVFALISRAGGSGVNHQAYCELHTMGYQASTRLTATVESASQGCYLVNGRTYIPSTGAISDVAATGNNLLVAVANNGNSRVLITAEGKIWANSGIGIGEDTELTISGGVVTIAKLHHSIDTEGDAASDNLDTINVGTFYTHTGDILILKPEAHTRVVTVKNGTGNICLNGGDYIMNAAASRLVVIRDGTDWYELSRA